MMRNTFYYAIFLLLFSACRQDDASSVGPEPGENHEVLAVQPDTAGRAERRRLVEAELDYYLQRHHVDEEGYDMVARYREQGNSLAAAFLPPLPATATGMLRLNCTPRHGTGAWRTADGAIVWGLWSADTLLSGLRIDTAGTYAGQFDRYGQPHAHGSLLTPDGTYFEGHMEHGRRQEFGFAVNEHGQKAGIWKNDRFLGERMSHASDRIYGIDISRYQHEQGKRKFGIDWSRMHITHLGEKAQRNAKDTVNYPVSFAYIKATEGLSIHNRYFAADYAAARRKGIRVGAYHFFSTRQSGRLQANYFLSQARFGHGDMPAMLDVEPTDALIRQMGGPEALFREIREWIKVVEVRTGARPLLYVNQRFVQKYLQLAPDLKRDYQIWIARYSEYKPDVHLAIWQLTPQGRVSGIRGSVDVNVFNGYAGQWEEFLRDETIP
ncbi:MAG: glycosyl hydrolase family 25 [Prevotella sp.]|nr:glycosyl hydrolase family 25 [Prevotella sp.]